MEKLESENINTTRRATPEIDGSMRKRCREMKPSSLRTFRHVSPEYAAQRAERRGAHISCRVCVCMFFVCVDVHLMSIRRMDPAACRTTFRLCVCECFDLLHSTTQHNFILVRCRVSYFVIIIYEPV